MTSSIDMHCHWLPEELAATLRLRRRPPRIAMEADGREIMHIYGETLPFSSDFVDIPRRLSHMDLHQTGLQVLSLPGLFGIDSLAAADSAPLVRLFNDALSALVHRHRGRFAGLAALPLADMSASCAEFVRARSSLGLIGAILPADGFLNLRIAERFRPLFRLGQEHGGHFFIHPGPLPGSSPARPDTGCPDNENQRHVSLAVQSRLSEAMLTLTMTDFLQPFAGVTVQVANLGGNLPWLIERMDHVAAIRSPGQSLPSGQVRARRVLVDCASFGPRAIRMAIDTFGAENVVLGTDHPIFDTQRTLTAIQELALHGTELTRLLQRNAMEVLERFSAARPYPADHENLS
jgi:predicted TIM-barrel fold metal-dependent hydrolase